MYKKPTHRFNSSKKPCADLKAMSQSAIWHTGKTMIEQAPRMLHEQFSEKFGQLQQWEQAQIISALERIVSMLDAEDIDAAPILDTQEIS